MGSTRATPWSYEGAQLRHYKSVITVRLITGICRAIESLDTTTSDYVVPSGFTSGGLPTSLQIICSAGDEAMALRIGWAFEQEMRPTMRRPPEP